MFPYKVYKRLREEQKELAVRIGRLEQFIDDHDNKGMNKELSDDYMNILIDQLESMKDYNNCLIHRIGIAVTEGVKREPHCVYGKAMDNKPKHELGDKANPAPKQDSDGVVVNEEYCNFNCYCDPAPKDFPCDPAIL